MRIDLEYYLWNHIGGPRDYNIRPRDVIDDMVNKGMIDSSMSAWITLDKWRQVGVYACGFYLDIGWKENPKFPRWDEYWDLVLNHGELK